MSILFILCYDFYEFMLDTWLMPQTRYFHYVLNSEDFQLQVTSEAELDGWSSAVHTSAAYDITATANKESGVRALKKELEKIEQRIDSVSLGKKANVFSKILAPLNIFL